LETIILSYVFRTALIDDDRHERIYGIGYRMTDAIIIDSTPQKPSSSWNGSLDTKSTWGNSKAQIQIGISRLLASCVVAGIMCHSRRHAWLLASPGVTGIVRCYWHRAFLLAPRVIEGIILLRSQERSSGHQVRQTWYSRDFHEFSWILSIKNQKNHRSKEHKIMNQWYQTKKSR